jgi:branched-chain amino acid transport system substrate-binding protein
VGRLGRRGFAAAPHPCGRVALLVLTSLAAAVALAGCGGKTDSSTLLPQGNRIRGNELTIYVSVPMYGPSAAAGKSVLRAAKLALAGHQRIGRYRIELKGLNDANQRTGQWSAALTTQNAQTAASDAGTIGYLGDFNSGASAVSIPILNRLAIPQVSATSTAVGLTSDGLGSSPGQQPIDYDPTPRLTFARVVPGDLTQADVQVELQKQAGCQSTYVLDDGEYDGSAMSQAFDAVASERDLDVLGKQSYVPGESSYLSVGQTIAQSGADCLLVSAITDTGAAKVVSQIAAADPSIEIFATAGLAESSFVNPAGGGVPYSVDSRLLVTAAAGDPKADFPQANTFWERYRSHYGHGQLVAIDGYEAMDLMLASIRRATDGGKKQAERVKVVKALFSTRRRRSPLGIYSIRRNGDTTLNRYGVYRVERGQLHFWKSMVG